MDCASADAACILGLTRVQFGRSDAPRRQHGADVSRCTSASAAIWLALLSTNSFVRRCASAVDAACLASLLRSSEVKAVASATEAALRASLSCSLVSVPCSSASVSCRSPRFLQLPATSCSFCVTRWTSAAAASCLCWLSNNCAVRRCTSAVATSRFDSVDFKRHSTSAICASAAAALFRILLFGLLDPELR